MSTPRMDCTSSGTSNGSPRQPEDNRKGRLADMLSAYYGIDATQNGAVPEPPSTPVIPMDQADFDSKKHFDGLVSECNSVADVIRHANEINGEVQDLDGDMNMVIYENYSKFIRATEVTSLVRNSTKAMEPDMARLQQGLDSITNLQHNIEESVSGRAREVEILLKRQRVCKKLQVLFELPTTLQRCLDRGAYGKACEVYSTCIVFLRQYKQVNTFRAVLEDVELQMGRIKSALELRLRSSELSSKDAVNSSITLLDLGEDPKRVAQDFLSGRVSAFRSRLSLCFSESPETDLGSNEALDKVCADITGTCVPELADAVVGFAKILDSIRGLGADTDGLDSDGILNDFVHEVVKSMCEQIADMAERTRPSVEVLVACALKVKESLETLGKSVANITDKALTKFLGRIGGDAVAGLFGVAASDMVVDLVALHGECSRSLTVDTAMEEVIRTGSANSSRLSQAFTSSQPLVNMVASSSKALDLLMENMQEQLSTFQATFILVSNKSLAEEEAVLSFAGGHKLPSELDAATDLEWNGLFVLALSWLSRRFHGRIMDGARNQVRMAFVEASSEPAPEFQFGVSAQSAMESLSEALLSNFVRASGQRLAHFLRNAVQRRGAVQATKPPTEPSLVVEIVWKEVHVFDSQLGKLLGDPRKPRTTGHRRIFNTCKSKMELDLEREWAKKMQVFAPIEFKRSNALAGIFRAAFKAFYEYVREETFTNFGLQQLQLDTEMLVEVSRDFVEAEDASALGSLLAEVVNSATERCREQVKLLEVSVVEALCGEKKRNMRHD